MEGKVYAGNLPWIVSADDLKQLFEPFGAVGSAEIVLDARSGRSRGFGFVQMESAAAAERAIAALDGMHWHGRPIKVAISRKKPDIGDVASP